VSSSSCQASGWWDAVAAHAMPGISARGKFVFVNVGANKGYGLAAVLQRFGNSSVTEQAWHARLLDFLRSKHVDEQRGHYSGVGAANPCGVCKACHDHTTALMEVPVDGTLFEISPSTTQWLEDAVGHLVQRQSGSLRHRVAVVNLAVGNVSGGTVQIQTSGAFGDERGNALESSSGNQTSSRMLPRVTLDEYFAAHGMEHVDYVSVDTEGHDLLVLRGLAQALARGAVDFLEFEFSGRAHLLPGVQLKPALEAMERYGYSCWWMGGPITAPAGNRTSAAAQRLLHSGCLTPASGLCWHDRFENPKFDHRLPFANILCASASMASGLWERADECRAALGDT